MKPSIKIVLNTRAIKKNETYPIALRITHHRLTRFVGLEWSVTPEEWIAEPGVISSTCKRYKNLTRVNKQILQFYTDKYEILEKLITSGEADQLTVTQLKNKLLQKEEQVLFGVYAEKVINELKLAKKDGNAFVYEQAVSFVKKYNNDCDIPFQKITFSFLKNVEARFMSGDNSLNGLSFYLRTVRAIYNRAIKDGVAREAWYPFKHYSIRSTKTKKRAIRKPDMDKIRGLNLVENSPKWHARNYFLFSFYNRGMNFADMAYLRVSNVGQDRITYRRSKTSKEFSVRITEPTRQLLNIYMKDKESDEFVFPIIERTDREGQMKDLYNKRRTLNKYLKRMGVECSIGTKITSYVARHSWATIAKDLNLPIAVISEGLGHEDIKTTQIYLDSFDKDIVDDANELVIG